MVKAKIKPSRFNEALSAVTVIVDTAELQFGPDGVRVQTVDRSNVGAVEMTLMSNAFSSFSGENVSFHVDLHRITTITRTLGDGEEIILEFDEDEKFLEVHAGEYDFEFGLINPESARSGRRASDISPPAHVKIKGEEISHAINLASKFSEEVILGISDRHEEFYINSIGDVDKMSVSFDESDDVIESISPQDAHAIYGLDLLSQMIKQVPRSEIIEVKLGLDYPAKFEFPIASGNGKITYGLAPRVSMKNR